MTRRVKDSAPGKLRDLVSALRTMSKAVGVVRSNQADYRERDVRCFLRMQVLRAAPIHGPEPDAPNDRWSALIRGDESKLLMMALNTVAIDNAKDKAEGPWLNQAINERTSLFRGAFRRMHHGTRTPGLRVKWRRETVAFARTIKPVTYLWLASVEFGRAFSRTISQYGVGGERILRMLAGDVTPDVLLGVDVELRELRSRVHARLRTRVRDELTPAVGEKPAPPRKERVRSAPESVKPLIAAAIKALARERGPGGFSAQDVCNHLGWPPSRASTVKGHADWITLMSLREDLQGGRRANRRRTRFRHDERRDSDPDRLPD